MKTKFSFKRTAEYLERQKTLALEFTRPLMRKAANPVAEARRLIARAVHLIERSRQTHDGAAAVGRALADVCRPYFGSDLASIAAMLR